MAEKGQSPLIVVAGPLALALRLQQQWKMARLLGVIGIFAAFGLLIYFNRYIPTPEEDDFNKKFERAVLVKTCGPEPGVASASPMKVYRFEEKLWYRDRHRWRQVDAKPENVCDLLDIEKGHESKPGPLPPGWSTSK